MEEDPVEAIEKALAEAGDLGNYDKLAEMQLEQLRRDYEATLAANRDPADEEEEEMPEPGYDYCGSGSEEDEEWGELQSAEEPKLEEPPATDKALSGDQVKRIKEAMQSLALPAPPWAASLSDAAFLDLIASKLRP